MTLKEKAFNVRRRVDGVPYIFFANNVNDMYNLYAMSETELKQSMDNNHDNHIDLPVSIYA